MAWLQSNRHELKQAAERGHPAAHRAMIEYTRYREARASAYPLITPDMERIQSSLCAALNDFCVEELNKAGRADMRGKYGYKESDHE
jgi:hypothetical protein